MFITGRNKCSCCGKNVITDEVSIPCNGLIEVIDYLCNCNNDNIKHHLRGYLNKQAGGSVTHIVRN